MSASWNDDCKTILLEARQVTVEVANHFLGTEHIAAAMLLQPFSLLERLLVEHGVDPDEVLELLADAATLGPLPHGENIPLTPRLRHVVRRADQLRQQADLSDIGEAHLLGAMLGGGRSVFVRVLEAFRLDVDGLLEALEPYLEGRVPPLSDTRQGPRTHSREALRRRWGAPTEAATPAQDEAARPSQRIVTDAPNAHPATGQRRHARAAEERPTLPQDEPAASGEAPLPRILPMLALGGGNPALLDWAGARGEASPKKKAPPRGKGLLDRIGRDLTDEARNQQLPPLIGREDELEQLQRALCRASRNSPLLVGDEGVGKSTLVAGLAWRVVSGAVPPALRGARVVEIPLAALASDTKFRGDLEERILGLLAEAREQNAVLVVNGIEALAATASSRAEGAAILRTALGRGEIRLIGLTTPAAFSRDIERDTALSRSLHPIRVDPPDEATSMRILQSVRERLEGFHLVRVREDALRAAYRLAAEHLKERQMPDAAIDLLDEACVKAASTPPDQPFSTHEDGPEVRPDTVASVVSQRTGIPLERLTHDERSRIAGLEDTLGAQVIGQEDAVARVSRRIRMFKAGFREERRPLGVFLFLSGLVGSEMCIRDSCVVLLDEIEKAHPRIFDLFLQVFDEGRLTDGRGVTTDFTHTLIVLTSNIGADLWKAEKRIGFRQGSASLLDTPQPEGRRGATPPDEDDEEERRKRLFETLRETFRLEFLNRLDDVIMFRPLDARVLRAITAQMVERWRIRSTERGLDFDVDPSVIELLCQKGYDPDLGARPMKRAVEQHLVGPLSRLVLDHDLPAGTRLRAAVRGGRVVFEERD